MKYKKGDKVFVSDWGKQYTDIYRWVKGERVKIWNWESEIPNYSNTTFHWKIESEPKLTLKGKPYKTKKIPVFKDFEYEVVESIIKPPKNLEVCNLPEKCYIDKTRSSLRCSCNDVIYLLKSKEGCWCQIGETGLTTLTSEEQAEMKEKSIRLGRFALEKQHLGKWCIDDDLKDFPEDLLKTIYDKDDNVLFGSSMTKGLVEYKYIEGKYTVDNIPLIAFTTISYDGTGLKALQESKKEYEFMHFHELPSKFTNQNFKV